MILKIKNFKIKKIIQNYGRKFFVKFVKMQKNFFSEKFIHISHGNPLKTGVKFFKFFPKNIHEQFIK